MLSIGGVVFFTLLLVTGNTMAIAVRDRIRELAVLKAVGYSDSFVLGLVLARGVAAGAGRRRPGHRAGETLDAGRRPDSRPAAVLLSSCQRRGVRASRWRCWSASSVEFCPRSRPCGSGSWTRCGGCEHGHSTDLQPAQLARALDLHRGRRAGHRRHGRRVRCHAVAGQGIQGNAGFLRLAPQRHRAPRRLHFGDGQRRHASISVKIIEDAPGVERGAIGRRWSARKSW